MSASPAVDRLTRSPAPAVPALSLSLALLFAAQASASAQELTRDLTLVAPAAPGGGWDQTARVLQHVLRTEGLARSVQVVNVAGAAGTIGLARFAQSEAGNPDALLVTGLVMLSGIVANQSPFTLADVTPIALISAEHEVVVVPAGSPHRTLRDLVDAFRANPRSVSWGGGSAGGTDEILVRLLAERVGVPQDGVNYIAYSGGGQAVAAVLGSHVTAAVSGLGEFAAQIEAGTLRALAVSSASRDSGSAIPTFRESDVDLVLLNWRALAAPPGITRAERRDLEALVRRAVESDSWREAAQRSGWQTIHMDGPALDRFIADETARIAPLVARSRGLGGTDVFAVVVLGGLAAASLGLVVASRRRRATAGTSATPADADTGHWRARELLVLGSVLVLNAALVNTVGFVIAAAAVFVATAWSFGSRRVLRDSLIALTLALAVYVGFTRALGLSLPAGPF